MSLAEELYERDYYAWTMEQADVLRRRQAGANALDYENLAGEVESLGSEQLHACESLLRQIVMHFIKIARADDGGVMDVPHWRAEILNFRAQIDDRLSATLRAKLEERAPGVIDRTLKAWRQVDRQQADVWRAEAPTLAECLEEEAFPRPGAGVLRPEGDPG